MDEQRKKINIITNLTLAAIFIECVLIWFHVICDEIIRHTPFLTVVWVLPRVVVFACVLGVLLAMRRWHEQWLIKLVFILVLALPLITFVFARWAFSFIP